jgi:hypothetical protein
MAMALVDNGQVEPSDNDIKIIGLDDIEDLGLRPFQYALATINIVETLRAAFWIHSTYHQTHGTRLVVDWDEAERSHALVDVFLSEYGLPAGDVGTDTRCERCPRFVPGPHLMYIQRVYMCRDGGHRSVMSPVFLEPITPLDTSVIDNSADQHDTIETTSRLSDMVLNTSTESSRCFDSSVPGLIGPVDRSVEDPEMDRLDGVDGSLRVPPREPSCRQQREASIAETLVVRRQCQCSRVPQLQVCEGIPSYDPSDIVFSFDMSAKHKASSLVDEGVRLTLAEEVERTLRLVDAWITWVMIHANEWQE